MREEGLLFVVEVVVVSELLGSVGMILNFVSNSFFFLLLYTHLYIYAGYILTQ